MAYDVSPYLLVPCRDLPTACKQAHYVRGLPEAPCGACALSDMCQRAMLEEAQAVSHRFQPVKGNTGRAIAFVSARKAAA